jgi:hypothetical protein
MNHDWQFTHDGDNSAHTRRDISTASSPQPSNSIVRFMLWTSRAESVDALFQENHTAARIQTTLSCFSQCLSFICNPRVAVCFGYLLSLSLESVVLWGARVSVRYWKACAHDHGGEPSAWLGCML